MTRAARHLTAAALLVLGLTGCAVASADMTVAEPSATTAAPSTTAPTSTTRTGEPGPDDPGRAPALLTIPSIDVSSQVEPVGTVDRVLQIPPEPWVVGWWEAGVGQGSDHGTTVLVAHLDSHTYGAGPFVRATDLEPGDRMTLRNSDGVPQRYRVAAVDTYLKQALPYQRIFAQTGPPRVVLVTCGGDYHADAGGWDSNVVVTFTPTAGP